MNDVRNTLKHLAVLYLLMLLVMLPVSETIPFAYPWKNISSLVLLTLSVCLFLRYYIRIAQRDCIRSLMLGIAAMLALLFFLRGAKYSAFTESDSPKRYAWYLYYAPMLLIPQLLFFIGVSLPADGTKQPLKKWLWTIPVTGIFIGLVVTNDLHQWVFRFLPQFENWDSTYHYGILFYLLKVWQYGLYILSVSLLLRKCRRSAAKRHAYLILIPFLLGIAMLALLFTGKMPKPNGANLLEFPESIGFMVAGILECCLALGLIPTNESYRDLMRISSVAAQITDYSGTPVYKSAAAADLSPEALTAPPVTPMDENTLLRKKELPGGYGFWQEDITELNRINAALAEAKEKLSEESNLIRLQNELYEKQRKIEHRIELYNEIARRTLSQSRQITGLSEKGLRTTDAGEKETIKKHITLLGAYIKRCANLMILADRHPQMNIAELGLSLGESLHYLEYYGIPGGIWNTARGEISSQVVLIAFSLYETVLESSLPQLKGVYVNLSQAEEGTLLKITLEGINAEIPREHGEALHACGIALRKEFDDGVTYLCLTLAKGGKSA